VLTHSLFFAKKNPSSQTEQERPSSVSLQLWKTGTKYQSLHSLSEDLSK
jgi:hypothetical protein